MRWGRGEFCRKGAALASQRPTTPGFQSFEGHATHGFLAGKVPRGLVSAALQPYPSWVPFGFGNIASRGSSGGLCSSWNALPGLPRESFGPRLERYHFPFGPFLPPHHIVLCGHSAHHIPLPSVEWKLCGQRPPCGSRGGWSPSLHTAGAQ